MTGAPIRSADIKLGDGSVVTLRAQQVEQLAGLKVSLDKHFDGWAVAGSGRPDNTARQVKAFEAFRAVRKAVG